MEHTLCLTYGQLCTYWFLTLIAGWVAAPLGRYVYQRLKTRD